MEYPIYQIDAFTDAAFGGNPAAVIPLMAWLDDVTLQSLAMENNLSETAFLVPKGRGFELRWFTPTVEVELCGHATLASAHVLFEHLGYEGESISFHTRSGELQVVKTSAGLTLNFPVCELDTGVVDPLVCSALGAPAVAAFDVKGTQNTLYVFASHQQIAKLKPDFVALCSASEGPIIVTAAGDGCDFVSRFFGPQIGLNEDPVTGSAHCALIPYWANILDKTTFKARQISARGGRLDCELRAERVLITGTCVTFMHGAVVLPD